MGVLMFSTVVKDIASQTIKNKRFKQEHEDKLCILDPNDSCKRKKSFNSIQKDLFESEK